MKLDSETIEIITLIVACVLMYCIGYIAGEIRQGYKDRYPKHTKTHRKPKVHTVDPGYDPTNPLNAKGGNNGGKFESEVYVDEDGNTWFMRRPL